VDSGFLCACLIIVAYFDRTACCECCNGIVPLHLFQHVYLSPADLDLITQGDALKNLNSYGLNARTRFALGRYVLCQLNAEHSFEALSSIPAYRLPSLIPLGLIVGRKYAPQHDAASISKQQRQHAQFLAGMEH